MTTAKRTPSDTTGTIRVTVDLTVSEAEALRDGAFTATSAVTHHAGRRALEKFRDAVSKKHPRPPLT